MEGRGSRPFRPDLWRAGTAARAALLSGVRRGLTTSRPSDFHPRPMSRNDRAPGHASTFLAAASALEAELKRFEDVAAVLGHAPLDSQKAIEHAARLTRDAADAQARFAERLQALVALVGGANERQRAAAAVINGRVAAIDARTAEHEALAARFGALGEEARGINGLVQEVTAGGGMPTTPERLAGLIERLEEIVARMGVAVAGAQAVAQEARAADFVDVERNADALRQQLQAARNRVGLLRRGLSS